MFRYLYAVVTLLIYLGGCAYYPDVHRDRLRSLPHHYVKYDATLAWEVTGVGSETVIEGEFKNARNFAMEGVAVWIEALDSAGKTMARSADFLVPNQLRMGEIAPFTVKLPVRALPGTPLRFTYKYTGSGADGGVGNMVQIFHTEIPVLPVLR